MGLDRQLQSIIDAAASFDIRIPSGEYEGPIYIRKPCKIHGQSAAIWCEKGPVLIIECENVSISDLRVEVTGNPDELDNYISISSKFTTAEFNNVEIVGQVKGVINEEDYWDFPKSISLGEFRSDKSNKYYLDISVGNETQILSNIKDVRIFPTELHKGINHINIETEPIKENTFIYGELLLKSKFTRRIYLTGRSKKLLNDYQDNRIIYETSLSDTTIVAPSELISPTVSESNVTVLKKGQRISIQNHQDDEIKILLEYSELLRELDVDPYVLELNAENKVNTDNDLIFFGNVCSDDKAVRYLENDAKKIICLNLNKASDNTMRFIIVYSIYGDDSNLNFSKIRLPIVRFIIGGKEIYRYKLEDLTLERTIVAVEIYRYKNEWKINVVGSGYNDSLKCLCEKYGVNIE